MDIAAASSNPSPKISGATGDSSPAVCGARFVAADRTAQESALKTLVEQQNDTPLADWFEATRQYAPDGATPDQAKEAALGAARAIIQRHDANGDKRLSQEEFCALLGVDAVAKSAQAATAFCLQLSKSAASIFERLAQRLGLSEETCDAKAAHALPIRGLLDGRKLVDLLAAQQGDKAGEALEARAQTVFKTLDVAGKGALGEEDLAAAVLLLDDPAAPGQKALDAHGDIVPQDASQAIKDHLKLFETIGKRLNGVIEPIAWPILLAMGMQPLAKPDEPDSGKPLNLLQAALEQVHVMFFGRPPAAAVEAPAPAEPAAPPNEPEPLAA